MRRRTWRNWAGNVQCGPAEIARPRTEGELAEVVGRAAAAGHGVRVAGSGHSYSELVSTDGVLISLERLRGIVEADPAAHEVTVWAGTRLRDIGDPLWERGFAMENLGDTNAQALAGAISTSTHGSGLRLGSLSSQVVGLTLITAAGESVECSERERPDLFSAARVGLGCFGVISRVRLRVQPAYRLEMETREEDLEAVLGDIEERLRHRHFEFWYWPDTAKVVTRTSDFTERPITENAIGRFLRQMVEENAVVWILSAIARQFPSLADEISGLQARQMSEGRRVDRAYRILATPRLVKLVETEYAVPAEAGPDCLREIKAWLDRSDLPVSFPIEYRYVAADDIPLSPFCGRESALIDLQQFEGMPYEEYFRAGEEMFKRFDGRPHWGKLHTRNAAELKELYPDWDRFQSLRRQWDPGGVFMNDYLRRVLEEASA